MILGVNADSSQQAQTHESTKPSQIRQNSRGRESELALCIPPPPIPPLPFFFYFFLLLLSPFGYLSFLACFCLLLLPILHSLLIHLPHFHVSSNSSLSIRPSSFVPPSDPSPICMTLFFPPLPSSYHPFAWLLSLSPLLTCLLFLPFSPSAFLPFSPSVILSFLLLLPFRP